MGLLKTITSNNNTANGDVLNQGDLNGNGITSLFRRTVSYNAGMNVGGVVMFDEIE
jgi:hypothetical protein